jgi:hypothetical protein
MSSSRRTKVVLALAASMAVASSAWAGGAQATDQGAARSGGNVASHAVNKSFARAAAKATRHYWTPQRMANATPYNPRPQGKSGGAAATTTSTGRKVSVAPTAGALGIPSGIEPASASAVPRPYTNLPDRLNVKIFFTKFSGGNFVCSGTIVNSTTKRMVNTAGHCVADGEASHRFHHNFLVVPAYSSSTNGSAPYGKYTARTVTTRTEWLNFGNFKQDLGYIITNDMNGVRIVNRLGGQGSTFNAARNQQWRAYGYPQAAPFNGFSQFVCPSGRLADDNPSTRSGPLTIRISCNMTGGASGGGWLINLSSAGLGNTNGLNSYKYGNQPNFMYGPYFGSEALSLFNHAVSLG